jgi:exonuclease V
MLYRHLLSELLSPTFSFSTFWEKVQVDPFAKFSDEFLQRSGVAPQTDGKVVLGFPECLEDVTDLWRSTVGSLCLQSVSPTLEIVYRTNSKRSAARVPKPSRADISGHFAAAGQEKRDIDRAIEASLREIGHDPDLERAIAESMRDVTRGEGSSTAVVDGKNTIASTRSPSPRGSEQLSDMSHIPWYAWSGETESGTAQSAVGQGPRPTQEWQEWNTAELRPSELQAALSQPEGPKVIGTKRFAFDGAAMHAYVRDVLHWWRGERPPRGVEVEQSHRCQ